jgi:hypothetical protein
MIYDLWVILSAIGVILLGLGLVDTFRDIKNVDWMDLLFFSVGFVLLLIGALNAATLDFILPNGTIFTDTNEAWAIIPMFGLSFLSMGLALMVVVLGFLHRNDLNMEF